FRQTLIDKGNSRPYINNLIDELKRIFRWGVSQQLIPVQIHQSLATVPGLRKNRTEAREPDPVKPVPDAVVEATLPQLPEVVADMVMLQRLTGARPGEVCLIRPCDVDTSGEVWLYRPESHKNEHHGTDRIICIGPKAQDVLRPYLLREKTAYCFSPVDSEKRRRAVAHANRKTPLAYGNRPGTNRRCKPKTRPSDRYDVDSYRRAIHRAVDKINRQREKQDDTQRLERWAPNRLRHTAGTEIRKTYGLEAAQVALGHTRADVTQIYAEKNLTLAVEVARNCG
ncbi:MAG: site-specific integrase, partial [Pirellulaceae bacterium]|nr:site-specific integrase [Pirellulaceae bacterium]